MEDLRTVLAGDRVIIGDGAVGTVLQGRGLPAGMMPEAWSRTNPDEIVAMHTAYVQAGAQYVTTNTFGATRIRLGEGGLGTDVAGYNELAVELARRAAADRAWVAGSIGPTGRLMQPYGDLSTAEAEDVFAEQVEALAAAGVDMLVVETQHSLEEATAAVRMALQLGTQPVFCSFAFNARGRTMMGLKAADAATQMEALGVSVVGANCGDGPEAVASALQAMRAATSLPLLARSNAGIPQLGAESRTIWDIEAEQMGAHARRFAELGARIVGGCCGTGPGHVAAIAAAVRHA